jgi:hypothetical protein
MRIIISVVENVQPTVQRFLPTNPKSVLDKESYLKLIATGGGSANQIYDWKVNSVIVQSSTDPILTAALI